MSDQPDGTPVESPEEAQLSLRQTAARPRAIALAWGAAGLLFFALGAIGAVLPLIPTTPFMLLAAFCFARSSQRLDAWFRRTKLYRTVLESYVTRRAMTVQAKLKILIPVSTLLLISFIAMDSVPVGRAVVAIIFLGHLIYFGFIVKTEKAGA